jgi:hypothetical protein
MSALVELDISTLTSLSNHLFGKTRYNKPRPVNMLIIEEDQVVVAWVLSM